MRFNFTVYSGLMTALLGFSTDSVAANASDQSLTPESSSRESGDTTTSKTAPTRSLPSYATCAHTPTTTDVDAAKGAYQAGQVSFQEADYEHAILYWEDAFRRDCTAIKLLLNIARAYELSGNRAAAIFSLETYLTRSADPINRGSIEKRIAKLKEKLQTEEETRQNTHPEPKHKTEPMLEPETPQTPIAKPLWPVFMTGGGAVATGVGIALAVSGQNSFKAIANDYGCNVKEETCPDNESRDAFNSDSKALSARTTRDIGIGLAIVGGATTVAGGVLWYLFWKDNSSNTAQNSTVSMHVLPLVSAQYQGLVWRGSF